MRQVERDVRIIVGLIMDPGRLVQLFRGAPGIVGRNAVLFKEFLAGGVIVPAPPQVEDWPPLPEDATPESTLDKLVPADHGQVRIYSIVQLDGDLALKVSPEFQRLSADRQERKLCAHRTLLRARLAPIDDLRDLLLAGTGLASLAIPVAGTANAVASGDVFWLIAGFVGVPLFAALRFLATRLLATWVRHRLQALLRRS